ncbi:MAG: hypothetical protein JWP04_2519 [Belnapia sp.]|nr:hypothetical protein [Belnapia sp.]
MEAVIALASLAQDARLRLAPGAAVMPVARLTLRPGEALPVLRVARQAGAAWQPTRQGASASPSQCSPQRSR